MWDVVRQWRNLPNIHRPSREESKALEVTAKVFQNTVVAPWYRRMADQVGNLLLTLLPAACIGFREC
jgi:hypothetical protein